MRPSDNEINEFVESLDSEGLQVLLEAYRHRQKHKQRTAFHAFRPGDLVYFQSQRAGGRVDGRVVRKLRKNILVEAINGARWRVSPTLLKER
jgi:hypothetical protein